LRSKRPKKLMPRHHKSPRHYAIAFLSATTPEQKKESVSGCPEEWQQLVRKHVEIYRGLHAANHGKRPEPDRPGDQLADRDAG
jgi:hypothetical protein